MVLTCGAVKYCTQERRSDSQGRGSGRGVKDYKGTSCIKIEFVLKVGDAQACSGAPPQLAWYTYTYLQCC